MTTPHQLIVAEFITLDGVVEDPDGTWGAPTGGWAMRQGPQVFAGDKFQLGPIMQTGSLLFGRRTWQPFSERWPNRTTDFAASINAARKYVASTTLDDVSAWTNSTVLEGDLPAAVARLREAGDVAVIGSTDVAHQLAATGLVDEYRLLVLPYVVGGGVRLFPDGQPADLRLVSADVLEPNVLLRYEVLRG